MKEILEILKNKDWTMTRQIAYAANLDIKVAKSLLQELYKSNKISRKKVLSRSGSSYIWKINKT